ncbi:dipeptidase PepE [Gallaecimonas sp. GXIMD1310]|uniref:dipeptidase PepE n=1 Tax=Gallaecimonas sp. GXIMD1310 TaxID=3131926 RepID=UPI0032472770
MRALLLSASRAGDTPYLSHALPFIDRHLAGDERELLFVPFAGVTISWDDYTAKVAEALAPLAISVKGLHQYPDPAQALAHAKAIAVGGGNTFRLLSELYQQQLLQPLQAAVSQGTPYMGWSAGANLAGKSIRTTNDMPIIHPPSFDALALVPFQINPHYSNATLPGHNGESRQDRLSEFLTLNPQEKVVCLPEGTALYRHGEQLTLLGEHEALLMTQPQIEILTPGQDLAWLLSGH